MKIYDPSFAVRLARLLQAKGTNVEAPLNVPFAGLVITIPGESLFENAGLPSISFLHEETDPAAGAEFEITIPQGEAWEPLALHARLVTSAAVATRYGTLLLHPNDVNKPLYRDGLINGQTATNTHEYSWAQGTQSQEDTGNGRRVRPFPRIILTQGQRIRSNTLNLQAADQWSRVRLVYLKGSYR